MVSIREVDSAEKEIINDIVAIHMETFPEFFLTFMGKGFLKQMYCSYCGHKKSGLLVAEENGKPVGFLAFSTDFSGLYKFMIRTRLICFAWFSILAFLRRPLSLFHILAAFFKPKEVARDEKYVELSSIGVKPTIKNQGVGSKLIEALKEKVNFNEFQYITLETDAIDNEAAICFYEKNGFVKRRMYETKESRKMYEYIYEEKTYL